MITDSEKKIKCLSLGRKGQKMITDEEREKYTSPGTYVHFTPRSKADPAVRYAKKLCSGLETNYE